MKVAVVGSRSFDDYALMEKELDAVHKVTPITLIVSGGAKGADLYAKRWALEHNIPYLEFLPDWEKYGKKAGFMRNEDIVQNADMVIAFWDSESRGTKHSIDLAAKYKKICVVVKFKPRPIPIPINFQAIRNAKNK